MNTAEDFRSGAAFFPRKGQDLTPYRVKAEFPNGEIVYTHPYTKAVIHMVADDVRADGGVVLAIVKCDADGRPTS